ncbi:hypothetical protein NDU88_005945 [Pleurodeles waltl]|uniref:Uncharacterized protein n=1 Tax=Pleurodeles waltl TaxID=8319 RepID=A0AAV7VKL8_PLEWA|nr:hypothetical protein NDU88_005945 [Pleurodeles waltl]
MAAHCLPKGTDPEIWPVRIRALHKAVRRGQEKVEPSAVWRRRCLPGAYWGQAGPGRNVEGPRPGEKQKSIRLWVSIRPHWTAQTCCRPSEYRLVMWRMSGDRDSALMLWRMMEGLNRL